MKKTKNFSFKQFSITGGYSGMPVSTDGVLLGAWMPLESISHLLDIGTGTGLLSLMCAQRSSIIKITAVEVDKHAIEAAKTNFKQSPWSQRIELIAGDVLSHCFEQKFDAIICNPPYFNSGEQSKSEQRATARHTDTLSHKQLLERCQNLLTESGYACFVLPIVEGEIFIELAEATGWHLKTRIDVKPTENKPVSRLLITLSKTPCTNQQQALQIHQDGGYSQDFIALTRDFYLKM